ncbi:MAG: IQ and ubiquitin-like domain-containing [Trebouxia sp. A1-2]|nr:MAG: IQ and ubiquitin-like domain-containing [Trebouxia sp. A1-2]
MEPDTAVEPQLAPSESNVTAINEGPNFPSHREGASAHSPISRSTSAVPLHSQQDDQQSGIAEESPQQAASEAAFVSEAAISLVSEAPLMGQPEQQGVAADTSGILASSHSEQEGNAASDKQLGEQELQNQATQPAVEQAPDASSGAAATSHPDEPTALPSLPEQLPSSAVQAVQDEPSVSGQEAEAAPFAHATFVVPTENWKHLQIVPLATTAAEIKHSLCSNWNIAETALSVKYNRHVLQDNQSLATCGIQPEQHVDIELVIHYQMLSSPAKHKAEPAKKAVLPERFEVHVLEGPDAQVKTVSVLVDVSQKQNKAYRGGYKDKRNGTLYHHADCQTDRQSAGGSRAMQAERECQTVEAKQRSAQTCREAHVQMARPDLLLDTSRDRILAARPYVSAAEVWAVKEKCAATVQRFTRGWLARRRLKIPRSASLSFSNVVLFSHMLSHPVCVFPCFQTAILIQHMHEEISAQAAEQEAAHRRREAQRRLQPRTSADFALLNSELEAWRLAETARIKAAGLSPEDCQQALAHLLHQETKLLQSIDRLRGEADVVKREQKVAEALATMAHPKTWALSNGALLEVHTPTTTKAGELRGLYRGLQLQGLTAGERLDVLLHVKFPAKEFDCSLTRELVQLIDREADLINRGRKAGSMEGLRKRISTLFLQFIENPMFNPEAANFFNLAVQTCSTETYMYSDMTAADSATIAAKSLLV